MAKQADLEAKKVWGDLPIPLVIAGPCSAESPAQMREVVEMLSSMKVPYIRAGVWKPRTRPGSFEGNGSDALAWLQDLQQEFDVKFAIEVATPEHVDQALRAGIGLVWIGARSTVNPFAVQEIANALKGVEIPVLVKNPINPDLALWLGALERIQKAGITQLGAIHRGFSSMQEQFYRNAPFWQIPLELKSLRPDLPLLCDPSHIGGRRALIPELSQKALDLSYDGLMIETHPNPASALSDPAQQWPLADFAALLSQLKTRHNAFRKEELQDRLSDIRAQIDHADRELLEALARRMKLVEQVGAYKKENNVAIFQIQRWKEVFRTRPEWAKALGLDEETVMELYRSIHQASIKKQTEIFNIHEQANHP